MHCPFCEAGDTRVIDSRLITDGQQIRRRRACLNCEERFTTYETAELLLPRVVKRDATRELYQEDKLKDGLLRALEKRPVSMEAVEMVLLTIRQRLLALGEREIQATVLGEWVMEALRELDEVAYVRFASVYREFQDVDAFKEMIDRLQTAEEEKHEKS